MNDILFRLYPYRFQFMLENKKTSVPKETLFRILLIIQFQKWVPQKHVLIRFFSYENLQGYSLDKTNTNKTDLLIFETVSKENESLDSNKLIFIIVADKGCLIIHYACLNTSHYRDVSLTSQIFLQKATSTIIAVYKQGNARSWKNNRSHPTSHARSRSYEAQDANSHPQKS